MIQSCSHLSWHALYTKPKQEARAVANMTAWGVETCAPWLTCQSRSNDRMPVFPRYIFARFDVEQMLHKISFTRGVLYVVSVGGRPAVVDDDAIAAIRFRTDKDGVVKPLNDLMPGDPVVIRSGSWQNMIGCFEKNLRGSDRVQILLTTVSYSARVQISRSEVARLTQPAAGNSTSRANVVGILRIEAQTPQVPSQARTLEHTVDAQCFQAAQLRQNPSSA